jgi:hypothetical protein
MECVVGFIVTMGLFSLCVFTSLMLQRGAKKIEEWWKNQK